MMRCVAPVLAAAICVLMAFSASATPFEPPVGSVLRTKLLDMMRPLAALDLGAPIVFRVIELQVDNETEVAFGRLMAERPGGVSVDMAQTLMVRSGDVDLGNVDGPRLEVLYRRVDGAWQVYRYALGSTDAWWHGAECDVFGAVLRDHGC